MLIQTKQQFDVILYGTTVAGLTAAITFAQNGVRVALVKPRSNSHNSGQVEYVTPTADRSLRSILRQQTLPTSPGKLEFWTRWGWIRNSGSDQGYFVEADALHSLLLNIAYRTNGVTLFRDAVIEQVVKNREAVFGLQIRQPENERSLQLLARLVVAADGSNSQLTQLSSRSQQPGRVYYHAYYELSGQPRAQIWLLDPDVAAIITHGDNLTQVIYAPAPKNLAAFQRDPEGSLAHNLAQLPDGPHIPFSTQISRVLGPVATGNIATTNNPPGLVCIGTAQLALPMFRANQLSMEIQAAHRLVESTLHALMVSGEIEKSLTEYRQQQRQLSRAYRQHNHELAMGRQFSQGEKLILAAAAHHPAAAERFFTYLNQSITRGQLLRPGTVIQALRRGEKPVPAKPQSVTQFP